MKRILMIVAAVLVATFAFAKIEIPKTLKIGEAAKKQPAVTFNHEQHATKLAKSCDVCHHKDKGLTAESAKKPEKCSACHLDPKDPKVPGMREMSLTKNPMHIRCIGCHKAEKKGPAVCTQCHRK